MNNMNAFLITKSDLVRYVSDKLIAFPIVSPWTMTILPGKSVGCCVHIATGTVSEEVVKNISDCYKQLSPTWTEITQAG